MTIRMEPGGPSSAWARKNAKTTLSACLLLAHLCGPPTRNRPNSELYSAAQSRDQAGIIFALAAKMVRLNPLLAETVRIQETAKTLACPELGTRYRALSAEATTAFGLSPSLIIHDELGRVRGPRSPLYEALETAVGAQEAPLSIVFSTQAATDGDLLSILIDDALRGHDPTTVARLYTAPPELDPFSEEAIRAANPALDAFMNKREVLAMAADARRMPARENEYRNLVLNQRVETSTPFLNVDAWAACGGEPLDLAGLSVFAGLDLSESADLTALVLATAIRVMACGMCGRSSGCRRSGWRRRRPTTVRPMTYGPSRATSKRRLAHRSIMSSSPSA
jgi:phage terminase large subunit-like protein